MRHRLLATTLFMLIGGLFAVSAQDKVDVEPQRHKWEVSANLLPLIEFNQNNVLPNSFFWIRRNWETSEGKKRAFRFRFRPYLLRNREKNSLLGGGPPSMYVFVSPGYEWQRQYGKFMLYYGADAVFQYDYSDVRLGVGLTPDDINITSQLTSNVTFGADAFLGAKYFFNHRLSASLETQLIYTHTDIFEERRLNGVITSRRVAAEDFLQYFGLYAITLNYHF